MILLIDDDADFRRGLAENLRDDGYEVREYETPLDLPPMEDLPHVDLAITDYQMPGENGFEFARRFRDTHPGVPVVLVTAFSTPQIENEATSSGFISMLNKPVDYDQLHRLIEGLCRGQ